MDPAAAAKNHTWDVGGQIEMMYGYDMAKIHSNGMGIYGGGGFDSSRPNSSPKTSLIRRRLFVDVAIPIGNGLLVRTGKFTTLLGYEAIQRPE